MGGNDVVELGFKAVGAEVEGDSVLTLSVVVTTVVVGRFGVLGVESLGTEEHGRGVWGDTSVGSTGSRCRRITSWDVDGLRHGEVSWVRHGTIRANTVANISLKVTFDFITRWKVGLCLVRYKLACPTNRSAVNTPTLVGGHV